MKKVFFIILSITLLHCSNNNDNRPENTLIASIMDKWWYPSDCRCSDFYIDSNGQYSQRHYETNEINDTGTWILVKEDKDSVLVKIDYDEPTSQLYATVWFKFFDIESQSLVVSISYDGISFGFPNPAYQDTDKIIP